MASVIRRIRRNVATREDIHVRVKYAARRIDVNERDAALAKAAADVRPRPARFARMLTAFAFALAFTGVPRGRS